MQNNALIHPHSTDVFRLRLKNTNLTPFQNNRIDYEKKSEISGFHSSEYVAPRSLLSTERHFKGVYCFVRPTSIAYLHPIFRARLTHRSDGEGSKHV
jgi:hypothetical protein